MATWRSNQRLPVCFWLFRRDPPPSPAAISKCCPYSPKCRGHQLDCCNGEWGDWRPQEFILPKFWSCKPAVNVSTKQLPSGRGLGVPCLVAIPDSDCLPQDLLCVCLLHDCGLLLLLLTEWEFPAAFSASEDSGNPRSVCPQAPAQLQPHGSHAPRLAMAGLLLPLRFCMLSPACLE